jgi:hypothetical protein
MSAPNYVTYFMLLSSIGVIAAALAGLRVAVGRADWEQSQRVAMLRTATVVLPLWFAVAVALSYAGAFRQRSSLVFSYPSSLASCGCGGPRQLCGSSTPYRRAGSSACSSIACSARYSW